MLIFKDQSLEIFMLALITLMEAYNATILKEVNQMASNSKQKGNLKILSVQFTNYQKSFMFLQIHQNLLEIKWLLMISKALSLKKK